MRRLATTLGVLLTGFALTFAVAQTAAAEDGVNEQGSPPTIVVSAGELAVGQPGTVMVSLVGGDVPSGDMGLPIAIGLSVDNGTVSADGGAAGTSASITGPFGSIRSGVKFTVVPDREGPITLQVTGSPVDRPQDGIAATSTAQVAPAVAPSPSPTSEPSTAAPVPEASTAASASSAPAPAPEPSLQPREARTPDLPEYRALDEPATVVDTTVTAVAVIGIVGIGAAAVAGAGGTLPMGGAPAPTAPGHGGTAPAGQQSGSGDRLASERRHDQAIADRYAAEDRARASGDLAGLGQAEHADWSTEAVDRARALTPPLTAALNAASTAVAVRIASFSPLTLRMVSDNAYLRAMLGSAALVLPIAGIVLGIAAGLQVDGLAMAPAVTLVAVIAFIGTLDALAGLLAFLAFTAIVAVSGGIVGPDSVRTLLGLLVIGCGPALIAGASRPIRRPRERYTGWERLSDVVLIPLIGAFAVQGMVRALPGLSGYAMPIADSANTIALVVLVGLLARVALEELVARAYPARLAAAMPRNVPAPGLSQRIVAGILRTAIFAFVAVAFIGNSWQLWLGTALFAVTQVFELLAPRMPNSPTLFHIVPVGIPKLVVIVLASLAIGTWLSLLLGESADLARTSFALLIVPGFLLAALGMFGREPAPGDRRWYERDSMRVVYRVGGICMLALGIGLTQFT